MVQYKWKAEAWRMSINQGKQDIFIVSFEYIFMNDLYF